MDAIRRRAIPHATRPMGRDPATGDTARDAPLMSENARKCSEMFGLCPEMFGNARTMVGYSRLCLAVQSVRHLLYGMRAAQRGALAAPPNGNCLNATALQKKLCPQNSGWRRRLQAMLGRGMAGDGRSARLTVTTAQTPRSVSYTHLTLPTKRIV